LLFINHIIFSPLEEEFMLRRGRLAAVSVVLAVLALSFLPGCLAANYEYTYRLLDEPGGSSRYELRVSVTASLYEYYQGRSHTIHGYLELGRFVTPDALSPVAESLRALYGDDEDFANAVLMIVHQIPYVAGGGQKYPVETIVENEGDCDLFSFIAASVMKAGGLDVVLLYYEEQSHMNLGVHLPQTPRGARYGVYYYTHGGRRYYMAECTGDNWEDGWRVGECSDRLKQAEALIIPLTNCEESAPGQVSSSYSPLAASILSLSLSKAIVADGGGVTISGTLEPANPGEPITIYMSQDGRWWDPVNQLTTDSDGRYLCAWFPRLGGTYYVRAGWSGGDGHAGADSGVHTVTVIQPNQALLLTLVLTSTAVSAAVLLVVGRRTARRLLEEVRVNPTLK